MALEFTRYTFPAEDILVPAMLQESNKTVYVAEKYYYFQLTHRSLQGLLCDLG
jgi:hypothetical protein